DHHHSAIDFSDFRASKQPPHNCSGCFRRSIQGNLTYNPCLFPSRGNRSRTSDHGEMMATAAAQVNDHPELTARRPKNAYDHVFFSGMAVLILATVFAGFAPTYYFAGIFR